MLTKERRKQVHESAVSAQDAIVSALNAQIQRVKCNDIVLLNTGVLMGIIDGLLILMDTATE